MSSVTTFAYSPNDFFYKTSNMLPSETECTIKYADMSWNETCNNCYTKQVNPGFTGNCTASWNDISGNCYNYQLCKNRAMADLANKQQNKNSGSDERYANARKEYDFELLHTVNNISGIIIIGYLTYYFLSQKSST
jgi:hypothetical protein